MRQMRERIAGAGLWAWRIRSASIGFPAARRTGARNRLVGDIGIDELPGTISASRFAAARARPQSAEAAV
jgi:hypothetical protein